MFFKCVMGILRVPKESPLDIFHSTPNNLRSDAETIGWIYGSNSPLLRASESLSVDINSCFTLSTLRLMKFCPDLSSVDEYLI